MVVISSCIIFEKIISWGLANGIKSPSRGENDHKVPSRFQLDRLVSGSLLVVIDLPDRLKDPSAGSRKSFTGFINGKSIDVKSDAPHFDLGIQKGAGNEVGDRTGFFPLQVGR